MTIFQGNSRSDILEPMLKPSDPSFGKQKALFKVIYETSNTRFEEILNLRKKILLFQRSRAYLFFHVSLWSQILAFSSKGEPLRINLKNLHVKSILKNDNVVKTDRQLSHLI